MYLEQIVYTLRFSYFNSCHVYTLIYYLYTIKVKEVEN